MVSETQPNTLPSDMKTPFRFEVWPTEYRTITQHFGANAHYYSQFGLPGHEGVDIRAPSGSKIYCVAPGRVYRIHKIADSHNYGLHVRVQHVDGYRSVYAHLESILVDVGQAVDAGTVLGLADNTGNSFGSHLHLMLKRQGAASDDWPNDIVDPTPFLLPLLAWKRPIGPYIGGWVASVTLSTNDELAQVNRGDATLRVDPETNIRVPEGTIVIVKGPSRNGFTPIQVSAASVDKFNLPLPANPSATPPKTISTVDGWAWHLFITPGEAAESQAVGIVNTPYGINLRREASQESANIGVVRRGSSVEILAPETDGYLKIRVRRADLIGNVDLPDAPPQTPPDPTEVLPENVYLAWIQLTAIKRRGLTAITSQRTLPVYNRPAQGSRTIGTLIGNATVTIAGQTKDGFAPVLVSRSSFIRLADPTPETEPPVPLPADQIKRMIYAGGQPLQSSVGGWILSSEMKIKKHPLIRADGNGLHLRQAPNRAAEIIGYVPAHTELLITDDAQGEFTPVRVEKPFLQPPIQNLSQVEEIGPDPPILGQVRIGLHASADPHISEAEHHEFNVMRPGIIKVLSFHNPKDILRLAQAHPNASWVVRAFLDFGGRHITPDQFLVGTLSDVQRTLSILADRDVVVELHNEPNIAAEGWGTSWTNGKTFVSWWQSVLAAYRQALPGVRFIYPGLSPGHAVIGIKQDHIQYIEESRAAVEAADGLGIHVYWSRHYPMNRAIEVVDDYLARFRNIPIWITEASNNKDGVSAEEKAEQYLTFWHALQSRPMIKGITYFVASASNPAFHEEIWVGRGIGQIIGRR